MLHGRRDPLLSAIKANADIYLLFSPDTPWIDDGTRQFGGAARGKFHRIIADELAMRGIAPVIIAGDWEQRRAAAVGAVTGLLAR
jgi:nicotinamide riboside kinase